MCRDQVLCTMQGGMLPLEELLQLRNAVLEADDLRRPVNLQHQVLIQERLLEQ